MELREATTASTRLRTFNARKIAARWILTVPSLMPRSRAISLFGLPCESRRITSIWRSVSRLRRPSIEWVESGFGDAVSLGCQPCACAFASSSGGM